jgi:CheY-like chemotaxis protein
MKCWRCLDTRCSWPFDGAMAVQCFQANIDSIDIVVLDVVMPGLSGPEAYSQMAAMRPKFGSGLHHRAYQRSGHSVFDDGAGRVGAPKALRFSES